MFYWHWRIRVSAEEIGNPTTREFGFAQNSVTVTVANRGSSTVEVQDVRLVFARRYGFPPLDKPPAPTNPKLPTRLDAGTAQTWHFPAEDLAVTLQNLAVIASTKRRLALLRPRVLTSVGSSHRGRRISFARDVNAHWRK